MDLPNMVPIHMDSESGAVLFTNGHIDLAVTSDDPQVFDLIRRAYYASPDIVRLSITVDDQA